MLIDVFVPFSLQAPVHPIPCREVDLLLNQLGDQLCKYTHPHSTHVHTCVSQEKLTYVRSYCKISLTNYVNFICFPILAFCNRCYSSSFPGEMNCRFWGHCVCACTFVLQCACVCIIDVSFNLREEKDYDEKHLRITSDQMLRISSPGNLEERYLLYTTSIGIWTPFLLLPKKNKLHTFNTCETPVMYTQTHVRTYIPSHMPSLSCHVAAIVVAIHKAKMRQLRNMTLAVLAVSLSFRDSVSSYVSLSLWNTCMHCWRIAALVVTWLIVCW